MTVDTEILAVEVPAELVVLDPDVFVIEVPTVTILQEPVTDIEVLEIPPEVSVLDTQTDIEILEVALQGVPGAQGVPGTAGSMYSTYKASGPIGGHRVVRPVFDDHVSYADNTVAADVNVVIGLTTGAAVDGADVYVQTSGELIEPSWTWTINQPVYLGTVGVLTQTLPVTGFILVVGIATAPTKLFIGIKQPIVL